VTLERRLARLEAKRGCGAAALAVIFRCDAITGEPFTATIPGQGRFARKIGEQAEGFKRRIASKLA
jgi:hypothetical protein